MACPIDLISPVTQLLRHLLPDFMEPFPTFKRLLLGNAIEASGIGGTQNHKTYGGINMLRWFIKCRLILKQRSKKNNLLSGDFAAVRS
jgi:hypothetical protein